MDVQRIMLDRKGVPLQVQARKQLIYSTTVRELKGFSLRFFHIYKVKKYMLLPAKLISVELQLIQYSSMKGCLLTSYESKLGIAKLLEFWI